MSRVRSDDDDEDAHGQSNTEEDEEDADEDPDSDGDSALLDVLRPIVEEEHEYLKADLRAACSQLRAFEREFGVSAVESRQSPLDDSITIDLRIRLDALPVWMLEEDLFLIVSLVGVSKVAYRLHPELPRVVVTRSSSSAVFAIGKQLEQIAMKLLRDTFPIPTELPELMDPESYGSFLVALHTDLTQRLPTLTEYCIICDRRLPTSGLLPSICKQELCIFQYDEIGFCREIATISSPPEVIDLLIAFLATATAAQAKNRQMTLDPFPLIRDEQGALRYGATCGDEDAASSLQRLAGDLAALPCARNLCQPDFLAALRLASPELAKLVTWIVSSNRAYFVPVPRRYQIAFMRTSHQYLTVVDSPAKHQRFMQLKRENGGRSSFVCHGSPMQNWHSILRNGLVIASGTARQLNGSAFGAGIYLSPDPSMSFRYSVTHSTPVPPPGPCNGTCCNRQDGSEILRYARDARVVLSICEVVENANVLKKHTSQIWVCSDADYICVRLLCVYTSMSSDVLGSSIVDGPTAMGIDERAVKAIRDAIAFFEGDDFNAKINALYGNEDHAGHDDDDVVILEDRVGNAIPSPKKRIKRNA